MKGLKEGSYSACNLSYQPETFSTIWGQTYCKELGHLSVNLNLPATWLSQVRSFCSSDDMVNIEIVTLNV